MAIKRGVSHYKGAQKGLTIIRPRGHLLPAPPVFGYAYVVESSMVEAIFMILY